MKDNKGTKKFWEGYAEGIADANRVKSVPELIREAVIPGTLPSEKGADYKSGYDKGKRDGQKKSK